MGLTKVGALWTGFDKNGNEYFSGKLEGLIGARIVVFKNTAKEGAELHPKAPQFNIYVGDDEDNQ